MAIFVKDAEEKYGIISSDNKDDFQSMLVLAKREHWEQIPKKSIPRYKFHDPGFKEFGLLPRGQHVAFVKNSGKTSNRKDIMKITVIQMEDDENTNIEKFIDIARGLHKNFGYDWYIVFMITTDGLQVTVSNLTALPHTELELFVKEKSQEGYECVELEKVPQSIAQLPNFQKCQKLAPHIKEVIYLLRSIEVN